MMGNDAGNKDSGVAAELAVAAELSRKGYGVAWPVGDNEKYDLIATSPSGNMYRIQVKSASLNRHQTYRVGFTHGRSRKYTYSTKDVDVLVVWLPFDDDYEDIYTPGYYVIPLAGFKQTKGIFYPPGKGRWPTWVCKHEKFRNNWGALK